MTDDTRYNLISADSHVLEPSDLFEKRLPAGLRHRAPRVVPLDGGSAWFIDGQDPVPLPQTAATGSGYGGHANGPVSYDDVLHALHDPGARVLAQQEDSLDAEILYPTPQLWDAIKLVEDDGLKLALVRAYNDWIAEFQAHSPNRLFGLAKVPTTNVEDARAELVRAVSELGLRGAVLDGWPSGGSVAGDRADDPFWEAVNDLRVPVSLHYAVGPFARTTPPVGIAPGLKPPMADALVPMVAAGVFDRYPEVRVVFAHGDAGWALHWMEFRDINYVRHKHLAEYALADPEAVPSEYIRRHSWFTFHHDRSAVKNRQRFGDVHLLWASHFPLEDSNWPDDREQAMHVTDELPDDHRQALLADNVARLYRLPGYEEGFTADQVATFEQLVHF